MKKLLHRFYPPLIYIFVSYSIFSNIGWSLVHKVYIPISGSIMLWLYVWNDVSNDSSVGIGKIENILMAVASMILFISSILFLLFWN